MYDRVGSVEQNRVLATACSEGGAPRYLPAHFPAAQRVCKRRPWGSERFLVRIGAQVLCNSRNKPNHLAVVDIQEMQNKFGVQSYSPREVIKIQGEYKNTS